MVKNDSGTNCTLFGSKYCDILNSLDCKSCPVRRAGTEGVKRDVDALEALLPQTGIGDLAASETCVLCRGEEKNEAACYAMVDLGNHEPPRESGYFLGMKAKMRSGSLLTVQLSCCASCRRRFKTLNYMYTILVVAVAALMMILLYYRPLYEAVAGVFLGFPLVLFLGTVGIAWAVSQSCRKKLIKKYEAHTYLQILEIPALAQMREKGWFELVPGRKVSRPVFSEKRLEQGLYTRIYQEKDEEKC